MRVCVVGLGKIGLPLAALCASRGLDVIGCDVSLSLVEAVNRGQCPLVNEPEAPELIAATVAEGRLRATTDTVAGAARSDVVVVVVPLLVDAALRLDYAAMDAAVEAVGRGLRPGTLVIVETTLPVGDTRGRAGPLLERVSGLHMGRDFFLAFSPERVQSTRVLRDLRSYPKIVGGIDAESTRRAGAFYARVLDAEIMCVSRVETAEFTKLAESVYRDVNIALANQLALYAQEAGVDMAEVIPAANSEPLSHLHRPGLGVGGHCVPVYPYFMLGQTAELSLAALAREVNDGMAQRAVASLTHALGGVAGKTVLILGLAYRANVKEAFLSPALTVAGALTRSGARIVVNDPLFSADEVRGYGLDPVDMDALPPIDAVVLHSYHAQYQKVDLTQVPGCRVILDGPGALDASRVEAAGRQYLRIGRGVGSTSDNPA